MKLLKTLTASSLGLGGMFRLDSRDNNLIPREGIYFNVEYLHYMNHYISNESSSVTSFTMSFLILDHILRLRIRLLMLFSFTPT